MVSMIVPWQIKFKLRKSYHFKMMMDGVFIVLTKEENKAKSILFVLFKTASDKLYVGSSKGIILFRMRYIKSKLPR